jgi:hypothetical protein
MFLSRFMLLFKAVPPQWALAGAVTALVVVALPALASERVYRCGQLYTNQPAPDQSCEVLTGGHVSVVGQARPTPPQSLAPATAKPRTSEPVRGRKPQAAETRTQEALAVLQSERERALTRLRQSQTQLQQTERSSPESGGEAIHAARQALERAQLDLQSLDREVARWERKSP